MVHPPKKHPGAFSESCFPNSSHQPDPINQQVPLALSLTSTPDLALSISTSAPALPRESRKSLHLLHQEPPPSPAGPSTLHQQHRDIRAHSGCLRLPGSLPPVTFRNRASRSPSLGAVSPPHPRSLSSSTPLRAAPQMARPALRPCCPPPRCAWNTHSPDPPEPHHPALSSREAVLATSLLPCRPPVTPHSHHPNICIYLSVQPLSPRV